MGHLLIKYNTRVTYQKKKYNTRVGYNSQPRRELLEGEFQVLFSVFFVFLLGYVSGQLRVTEYTCYEIVPCARWQFL